MEKTKWLQLNPSDRIVYVEDLLDKLKVTTEKAEKKEIERKIFNLIEWQEQIDE